MSVDRKSRPSCERWRRATAANQTNANSTDPPLAAPLSEEEEEECPCVPLQYEGEPEMPSPEAPEGCEFLSLDEIDLPPPASPYENYFIMAVCIFSAFLFVQFILIYRKWQGFDLIPIEPPSTEKIFNHAYFLTRRAEGEVQRRVTIYPFQTSFRMSLPNENLPRRTWSGVGAVWRLSLAAGGAKR